MHTCPNCQQQFEVHPKLVDHFARNDECLRQARALEFGARLQARDFDGAAGMLGLGRAADLAVVQTMETPAPARPVDVVARFEAEMRRRCTVAMAGEVAR